jgi:hypothetical protein
MGAGRVGGWIEESRGYLGLETDGGVDAWVLERRMSLDDG